MQNWVLPFIITASYTVIAVILGITAKGQMDMNKIENWGAAGRTLGSILTYFLMGAGAVSAYTFMGAPGWAFTKGVPIVYVIVYLIYQAYNYYFLGGRAWRVSNEYGYLTQAHTFGARYESTGVRAVSSAVTSIGILLYGVLQIAGCGYVINVMSGGHIPFWAGETIIAVAICIYVFASGLRAIGWTNALQGGMMMIISWVAGCMICYKYTGTIWFNRVFEKVAEVSPEHLVLPGATGEWTPIFWTTSILVSVFSFWPTMWIMATSSKSLKELRKASSLLPTFYISMIPMIVVGFACVFLTPDYAGSADSAALSLALNSLPWLVAGLLGAGTLAAAQSSCEPMVQGAAFSWAFDIFGPLLHLSEEKVGKLQRWLLLPVMFLVVLPIAIKNPASLVYLLLIGYGFTGQIFPLIIGTFFWPRSNKCGALTGMFAGVFVLALFTFVWPHPLGIHAGIWGLMVNIPLHVIVSLATKPESKSTIEKFFPKHVVDKLYVKVSRTDETVVTG